MNGKRPYKLPEPLLCSADKEINMTLVDEYIRKHEERMPRYRYLENLYKGFHDVSVFRKRSHGSRITDWR